MANHPDTPNYHPLVRSVARALRQRCGVGEAAAIVVGCSGGADSVALLRALALLAGRRKWGLRLIVGHVQHHLRGDLAEADATFVMRLAEQLGLTYERRDIEPAALTGNLEANARKLRYRALLDIAVAHDAQHIATAHHADDQLETLLMRLLRGASVQGLRGIAWRRRLRTDDEAMRIDVIRPMLGVKRERVLDLLDQLDQPWREDATNTDTTRTRAKLRHDIIPRLKSIQPDAAGKAVALSEQFAHLSQLVKSQADPIIGDARQSSGAQQNQGHPALSREEARGLNPIVLHHWLRRALIRAGVSKDRLSGQALSPVIEAARDHAGGVREFGFEGGVQVAVDSEKLWITA